MTVIRVYFSPTCPNCEAIIELLKAFCIVTNSCYLDLVLADEEVEVYRERIEYGARDITRVVKALFEGAVPVVEIGNVVRFRFFGLPPIPRKYFRMYATEKLTGVEFDIPKKWREKLDNIWKNLERLVKICNAIESRYLGLGR